MAGAVTVTGLNKPMGGLRESLAEFRKHSKEVGDALLNISGVNTSTGDVVDKDEPRPEYHPRENAFPRMIYHSIHGELIVESDGELKEKLKQGWRTDQFQKPRVLVQDAATEKKELLDRNRFLEAQIVQQNEVIEKQNRAFDELQRRMEERLQALEVKK